MLLTDQSLLVERSAGTPDIYEYYISSLCPDHTIVWFTQEMTVSGVTASIDSTDMVPFTIGAAHPDNPNAFCRVIRISSKPLIGWNIEAFYYTGSTSQTYAYAGRKTHHTGTAYITVSNFTEYRETSDTDFNEDMVDYISINGVGTVVDLAGSTQKETIPFAQLDRANPRITKIIKLPYPPVEIKVDSGGLVRFPEGWFFNNAYKAMELNLTHQNVFTTNLQEYEFEDEFVCELDSAPAAFNEYLNYGMESKLYNSEFYNISLMYDNVSNQIKLERLDFVDIPKIKPVFYVPNSMTNTMMFKVEYPNTYRDPEYPYDDVILSTRSNEMTIFSSGYVDYLRNGYNFDREAREQQNRQQILNAVITTIGAAASIAAGGVGLGLATTAVAAGQQLLSSYAADVTSYGGQVINGKAITGTKYPEELINQGFKEDEIQYFQEESIRAYNQQVDKSKQNAALKAHTQTTATMQMAQSGLNTVSSIYNAAESIAANSRNFQSSLVQKQTMNVGAQGSADVDLMSVYAKNRLMVHKYTLREQDLINLARVFYYTGYAHPLQEIPNWSSRYWFNFVQCTPYFNNEQTCVYHNYINDIKARLGLGVTVYHEHNGEYDLDQTKENWETWLID